MVDYVEEFVALERRFGIEDMEEPGRHFFPDDKTRKRFQCWVGGGGIGGYDTLQEARDRMRVYLRGRIEQKLRELGAEMELVQEAYELMERLP